MDERYRVEFLTEIWYPNVPRALIFLWSDITAKMKRNLSWSDS